MQIKSRLFGTVILTALALVPAASATEIVTTSYSAWLATTSSSSEWNFAFTGNGSYSNATGYSLNLSSGSFGTTTVTGPDGGSFNLNKNPNYGANGNTYALQGASDGTGSMVFTTPTAGLTAVLFGLGISGNAAPVNITLSDGETFTVNPAVNGVALFGLSSATPITSFTLTTSTGSAIELTDFFAGNSNAPASAPAAEVATAIMIGSGLLFFGARRKIFSNFSLKQA